MTPNSPTVGLRRITTPIDVYRAANLLVGQHGESALIYAALRADHLFDRCDLNGRAVWLRVIDAIRNLQETEPSGPIH